MAGAVRQLLPVLGTGRRHGMDPLELRMQIQYAQKSEENVIAEMSDSFGNDNNMLGNLIPASWSLNDNQIAFIASLLEDGAES